MRSSGPARYRKAALDEAYDDAAYEHRIYDDPPDPPPSPEDAAWARGFLPRRA